MNKFGQVPSDGRQMSLEGGGGPMSVQERSGWGVPCLMWGDQGWEGHMCSEVKSFMSNGDPLDRMMDRHD